MDNNLTKNQYTNIRIGSKARNSNIYPSYDKVLIAKKQCYPNNVIITECSAEIPLQDLLNHTAQRILQIPSVHCMNINIEKCELLSKWGCDGSNGQSQYRINFDSSTTQSVRDSDMFMFSFVPLQMSCTIEDNKFII